MMEVPEGAAGGGKCFPSLRHQGTIDSAARSFDDDRLSVVATADRSARTVVRSTAIISGFSKVALKPSVAVRYVDPIGVGRHGAPLPGVALENSLDPRLRTSQPFGLTASCVALKQAHSRAEICF